MATKNNYVNFIDFGRKGRSIPMKEMFESDVFKFLDKDVNIRERITVTYTTPGMMDGKIALEEDLKKLAKIYKDSISVSALAAVNRGDVIIIFNEKSTKRLPVWCPFFKIKKNGISKTVVDVTNYVQSHTDRATGEYTATVPYKKLYSLIVGAYIFSICDKRTVLTPRMRKYCALVWAKMFCKVLAMKVGLQSNKDRYDAFMYFAMRYFMEYILETPPAISEAEAKSYFAGGVLNSTAAHIEQACQDRNIDLYSNFTIFCTTLFNNDITGIRGMRLNSGDNINFAYFLRQYMQLYYLPIALSLVSFPHFIWAIFSANQFAYIFNDKLISTNVSVDEYPIISVELQSMAVEHRN